MFLFSELVLKMNIPTEHHKFCYLKYQIGRAHV